MNPASFLVNAKGYAPYYNYSFIDNSSRIEGMERFFRRIDLLSSQEMPPHESLELETNKRLDRFLSNQNSRYDQEDLGFFHKSLKSVVSPFWNLTDRMKIQAGLQGSCRLGISGGLGSEKIERHQEGR